MATDFIVELVLTGHDVFLLEDERTHGRGASSGYQKNSRPNGYGGYSAGVGGGTGCGNGSGICSVAGGTHGEGDGHGNAFSNTSWNSPHTTKKEQYGYQLHR